MRIRVVTLNVWNTEGAARRLEIINRELRRIDPDLIAFQEVVQTRDVRMLDRMLEGLSLHCTHQADVQTFSPPFSDRYGGSAIATRWPHRAVEALDLRMAGTGDVPWATLAVVVDLPQLGELLFIGATAAWRLDAEVARERQAIAITDLDARHRRDLPTIIAGDFNATPDAASIRYLSGLQSLDGRSVRYHDAWAVAGDGPGYTWAIDNPNALVGANQIIKQPCQRKRFDYVFVGSWDAHPEAHAFVQSATLAFNTPVDGVWASDHFGVVVDVEVGLEA
ncbi:MULTISPECIES: endonuclease/exonuclease/phosphatase family protein [unclassified Sinorhizobium]|uniref:endonuclease/exonuclease/phosphatase family protein n=1 Tax=unclassified Sinorhizobium TaxID=2613772 RepID=UPI00352463C8